MIEHWYDYLPAAWYTEGRWYVLISLSKKGKLANGLLVNLASLTVHNDTCRIFKV